ncbi:MAG TPA: ABC transporter substrate-binding protein [Acidimicrobiales bacterium]|jgi:hypothetical protein|nr:ABC transporter substrate-binding protein [Acidimicrobiales bacterium]HJM97555.1 ABC transporter substrate-binding protein [Acidimicrobiales bacterium]
MKRLLLGLPILLLVSMSLFSCGGSDGEQSSSSSAQTTETSSDTSSEESEAEPAEDQEETVEETSEDQEETVEETTPVEEEEEEEERIASDVGVTEDKITIAVIIADLSGLRDIGYPLPDGLTNEALSGRIGTYLEDWNEAGGINGRTFEMVEITWNPLDAATMENACTEATLDNEVFLVVNSSGFNPAYVPCFTEDNDTVFLLGDKAPQYMFDAAPDRLFGFFPPGEIAAVQAGRIFLTETDLAVGSKIGILEPNNPAAQAASVEVKDMLEDAGFETVTITINTASGDNAASNAEAAASVSQFNAEGVSEVFVLLGFIQTDGFFGEIEALDVSWGRTLVDVAPGMCTQFGASRTNPAAEGSSCVTSTDAYSLLEGGLREDRPFEAQCREEWLNHFPVFEGRSDRGVPSGEVGLETADGELLNSDYAYADCNIVNAMKHAFENAGVNPTRDSFAAALKTYSGFAATMSNGEGAFGPDKNYYSTQMWQVEFRVVSKDTPRGDDGKFNGCPAPTNCWIPVTGTWFNIE